MPATTAELARLLDLEEIEVGLFRGAQPVTSMQRAFGGQVLAQALLAATRTVPTDRPMHSLHAYFLRPGATTTPIIYDVEDTRDGGSFSSRRVQARQNGSVIFTLSGSFHVMEAGFDHGDPVPRDVPPPEKSWPLAKLEEQLGGRPEQEWEAEFGVLDVRVANSTLPGGGLVDPRHPARTRIWIKLVESLDPPPAVLPRVLHQAVLAYASDLTLLAATLVPHGMRPQQVQMASLDHSMWFHRPFRADQWLLYDQISPSATGAVGLSTGRLFQDGRLVASVAQEGLIRPIGQGTGSGRRGTSEPGGVSAARP